MYKDNDMKIISNSAEYPIYFSSLHEGNKSQLKGPCEGYNLGRTTFYSVIEAWFIHHPKCGKVMIITDLNVEKAQSETLNQLTDLLFQLNRVVSIYVIEPGEGSKSLQCAESIWDRLAAQTFSRSDVVIAFGGGVVGDLAGFCASVYMRGIPFIQIPTTLLAQIDSSIGGKVAINLPQGKNLVGAFYDPEMVIISTDFLKTLPSEVLSDGIGEMLKYGFLGCIDIIEYLSKYPNIKSFKEGLMEDSDAFSNVVSLCLRCKKVIVENDYKENGIRKYLNLGHTIGHGLESYSKYAYTHGHCVANGLLWVMMLWRLEDEARWLREMMARFEIPILDKIVIIEIMSFLMNDKKSEGDGVTFVIPKKLEFEIINSMINNESTQNRIEDYSVIQQDYAGEEWLNKILSSAELKWLSFDEIESMFKTYMKDLAKE